MTDTQKDAAVELTGIIASCVFGARCGWMYGILLYFGLGIVPIVLLLLDNGGSPLPSEPEKLRQVLNDTIRTHAIQLLTLNVVIILISIFE